MLLSAVSLAFLLAAHVANAQECTTVGTTAPVVSGTNNYVIDKFQILSFTYAIDQCTSTTPVTDGSMYKYSCSKENNVWKVTKYKYAGTTCEGDPVVDDSWTAGDATAGNVGYFECSGENTYVKVEIAPNACKDLVVVYAGLNGCAYNSPRPTRFYCDDSQALVELFSAYSTSSRRLLASTTGVDSSTDMATTEMSSEAPDTTTTTTAAATTTTTTPAPTPSTVLCGSDLYCTSWQFNSTCKQVFSIPYGGSLIPIYGKFDECKLVAETTVVDGKSGASSLFVITNLAVAIAVALFSLF